MCSIAPDVDYRDSMSLLVHQPGPSGGHRTHTHTHPCELSFQKPVQPGMYTDPWHKNQLHVILLPSGLKSPTALHLILSQGRRWE